MARFIAWTRVLRRLSTRQDVMILVMILIIVCLVYDRYNFESKSKDDTISQSQADLRSGNNKNDILANPPDKQTKDISEKSRNKGAYDDIRYCTQQERLDHLRFICQRESHNPLHLAKKKLDGLPKAPMHSIADFKHRVMYCSMSKLGSSAFKGLLQQAGGVKLTSNSSKAIHSVKSLNKAGLMVLNQITNTTAQQFILEHYFRFFNVRHPLERLLSAYRDKVSRPSDMPGFAKAVLKFTRADLFAKNETLQKMMYPQSLIGHPTFSEFVSWVSGAGAMNTHWALVAKECLPCSIAWDAIFRIETMEKDSNLLLERLKPDVPFETVPEKHSRDKVTNRFHFFKKVPEFESVSSSNIEKLLEMFSPDMDLFGYKWDMDTKTAYCAINVADGRCC